MKKYKRALAHLGFPRRHRKKIVSNEKDGAPSKEPGIPFYPLYSFFLLALGLYVGWEKWRPGLP